MHHLPRTGRTQHRIGVGKSSPHGGRIGAFTAIRFAADQGVGKWILLSAQHGNPG